MKRFLLYLVIAIAVVSLGLTIYYFSTDNEVIYIKSSYLTVNKGDIIEVSDNNNELLDFKNRSEYTTLSYSATNEISNNGDIPEENVLDFNDNEFYFTANIGGKSKITITTNNRSYSKFIVDVLVCDGSEEYPYIVRTEEELRDTSRFSKDESISNYNYNLKLGNDIELTKPWKPIPEYDKVFDGNYFTIKNMNITDESLTNSSNEEEVYFAPSSSSPITNAGFISILKNAGVVKNLTLENLNINCSVAYIGSFAGTSYGLIQTSEVTGDSKIQSNNGSVYIGGVAGRVITDETRSKIDRCGFEGEITANGTNQTIGGVAGQNLAGMISETYSRSYVKNGQNKFGGIVGLNQADSKYSADIYDSYFYLTNINSTDNTTSLTIFENMRGIAYQNADSSLQNVVTGNYYGGKITNGDIALAPASPSDNFLSSSSNGYLTSEFNEGSTEFEDKDSFVTARYSNDEIRTWNFNSVWEIPNLVHYPVLNKYSTVGSTYLIDVSNLESNHIIENAQDLYNALYYNYLSEEPEKEVYLIKKDIPLDANSSQHFVWGDSTHPLPGVFKGTIINGTTTDAVSGETRPCEITGITIRYDTPNEKGRVGLTQTLSSSAKMIGLVIKDVTIEGDKEAKNVGVLAGVSLGSHIYNVKIEHVTVTLSGTNFGGVVGYYDDYDGHAIDNVSIKDINATNAYYVNAGGIVGYNLGTIATENSNYNTVEFVRFVANYVGGVVGENGGKVYNCNAQDVKFNVMNTSETIKNVYKGTYHVFVGGIAGTNEITLDTGKIKGSIYDVYANLNCTAETAYNYNLYIGGIVGFNSNVIVKAYVNSLYVNVTGSQSAIIGGIAGYNTGSISSSVVDDQSELIAPTVASIEPTKNYVLNTKNCSIVGGLVGLDAQTSNATYSLYKCASLARKIQGYYAGGISAVSFGKVEYCYCGNRAKENGGVTITGHMIGGISAVIAGGFVDNCYTVCKLNSENNTSAKYKDITSALNMDVRCMGGIAVFVFNSNTSVYSCYAVVTFSGNGVSYGCCADGYNIGKVSNCVYTTIGNIKNSKGTQLSKANLNGADGYKTFGKAIGLTSESIWDYTNGYPALKGVDVSLPNSVLPKM